MIKKYLQKIFKKISYGVFFKIYGSIEDSIENNKDNRIKVKLINIDKELSYKVYIISNGRLYTDRIHDTAAILDNKIIEGPSFQFRQITNPKANSKLRNEINCGRYPNTPNIIINSKTRNNIVFSKGTPRKLRNLNGSVLSLLTGGGGNNNYWHWLFDVLPRFGLCSRTINLNEIDYFLLPSLLKKFQRETLDCLNIPKHKRISSEKFRHIKAKELIMTDHPLVTSGNATKDNLNIHNWIISWLKDNFLNPDIIINQKIKNKIYIDRSDTISNHLPQRLISNEDEIKKYLLKNNFIFVKLHETKFREQINLFHNAECIVGLHGAGFVNVVFCKPGTKIIELRGLSTGDTINNLSKKNDLNYNSIDVEAKETYKFDYPTQHGNIQIPINSLIKVLEN